MRMCVRRECVRLSWSLRRDQKFSCANAVVMRAFNSVYAQAVLRPHVSFQMVSKVAADLVSNVGPVRVVRNEDKVVPVGPLGIKSVEKIAAFLFERVRI